MSVDETAKRPGRASRGDVSRELTERDLEAIHCYGEMVDDLCGIFGEELKILEAGQVDQIPEIFERKQKVVQSMEIKMPIIEGLIGHPGEEMAALKIKMAAMYEQAAMVSVRIERIAAATTAVMREINKVQERHSLSGMYSPDGRKRGASSNPRKRIDESF